MTHKCEKEPMFEVILYEIRETRKDVKKLTAWKWSVYGGAFVISMAIGLLLQ